MLLCHDAALRSSTAMRLTWSQIQGDAEEVVTRTKRDLVVRVPISGRLRGVVNSCPRRDGPLVQLLAGKPLSPSTIRKQFQRLLLSQGFAPGIRLHDLRRTMAQAVYAVTSDLRVTQSLLGHDNLHSTFRYLAQPSGATQAALTTALLTAQGSTK